jgi:Pilus formation protein N terminal region
MRIFVLLVAFSLGWLSRICPVWALEAEQRIVVSLDHATLLNLPPHSRSIVVGNPAIVRVTPMADAPAILTGEAFGETNIVVLDEVGRVLMEAAVFVEPQPDAGPSLLRGGLDSTAYSCGSHCEVVRDLAHNSPETDAVQSEFQARDNGTLAIPQSPPAIPQANGSL